MIVSLLFFAVMMFLFWRVASWPLFIIASALLLGLAALGGIQMAAPGDWTWLRYWAAYAAIFAGGGFIATKNGRAAAARRRERKADVS